MSKVEKNQISENLSEVSDSIQKAVDDSGREKGSVSLIAVSKKKPIELIKEAIDWGQNNFGENYVKEAAEKIPLARDYSSSELTFHLIGHLQSNKAKLAVELFDVFQTVDSIRLHDALANQCEKQGVQREALIQVNVSGEQQKSGISPSDLPQLVEQFKQSQSLRLKGLMMIGSFSNPLGQPNRKKGEFESLAYLSKREADRADIELSELSMGMSGDLQQAIGFGSTMVRVGTAIFGERS